MPTFLKVIVALLATIIVVVSISAYVLGGPAREVKNNLFMNAISQQTNKWDTRVELTPTPLNVGMSAEEVKSSLSAAGFVITERVIIPTLWMGHEEETRQRGLQNDEEIVFTLEHGDFVCSKRYVVFIKLDKIQNLQSAQGLIVGTGCL